LARLVGETGSVVGVEGSEAMTARAADNARRNGINNTEFYSQDLTQDCTDKPSRATNPASVEIMQYLPKSNERMSMFLNPATLLKTRKHY
jgi:23S rRNA (uracil1939-C5)-methyltransferase